jgi:hypothetical protein
MAAEFDRLPSYEPMTMRTTMKTTTTTTILRRQDAIMVVLARGVRSKRFHLWHAGRCNKLLGRYWINVPARTSMEK